MVFVTVKETPPKIPTTNSNTTFYNTATPFTHPPPFIIQYVRIYKRAAAKQSKTTTHKRSASCDGHRVTSLRRLRALFQAAPILHNSIYWSIIDFGGNTTPRAPPYDDDGGGLITQKMMMMWPSDWWGSLASICAVIVWMTHACRERKEAGMV